ncbi:MAG: alternative ribosome rescue aminoacyl-tRNA hydrolase ArfB [Rhodospirillales bacterium]|nr:alternative ribosome rescue aminoacyl-tRNA hydrolase ArfB [Rhodospirillales bacterium]
MFIAPDIEIDESEIQLRFILAGGPGGQNVNKVATAVELRFDATGSDALPDDVKHRLKSLAGRRMTAAGILVIKARRFRSQEMNRADARARLRDLIERAVKKQLRRRPTKPTRGSRERRLGDKQHRGKVKRQRGPVSGED